MNRWLGVNVAEQQGLWSFPGCPAANIVRALEGGTRPAHGGNRKGSWTLGGKQVLGGNDETGIWLSLHWSDSRTYQWGCAWLMTSITGDYPDIQIH